jgi:flagellar biosynthesis protein FlhG
VGITDERPTSTSIVRSRVSKERGTKMGSEPMIWAVGGGKGGVGKSVVSIFMAYWLARMGNRTVVADFDLGGGNIHTLMGVKRAPYNLYDFISKKCASLDDICIDTPAENLRLIAGASGVLSLANPQFSQKEKLIQNLAKLNADYVVLDLGAGTSFSVLDFFLAADEKIVVLTPEPTSIQNAYVFLRNGVYRMLSRFSRKSESLQAIIKSAMNPENELNVRTVREVLQHLEDMGRENFAEPLRKELGLIRPACIVNMARNDKEKVASRIIQVTSEKYLMIDSVDIGNVSYDEQLPRMIDNMVPIIQIDGSCAALANTYEIVRKLLGHREPDRISAYAA